MEIPHLRMDATYGKIGLRTKDGKLSIRQRQAEMTIRQPKAEMTIRSVGGKLNIDQSKAFAESGLKSVFQLNEEYVRRGRSAVLEGIARRAREGDRLMKIENSGHPIADIARSNSSDPPLRFNIGWMPKSPFSVKFSYQPVDVRIQWQIHRPQINVRPQSPEFSYAPASVSGFMRQRASLDIEVVGLRYDENV